MTLVRQKLTALLAVAVLGPVGLAASEGAGEPDRLTRPTQVVLDFKDQPIASVVEAIGDRTGKHISAIGAFTKGFVLGEPDRSWRDRRVTLLAPEPVPFWDAIDRLAAAGKVRYRLSDWGDTGFSSSGVSFEGDGEAPGLACYSGAFRVGLFGIHEHREAILVRAPWVRVYPSGYPVPGDIDPDEQGEAPPQGGPLYAELKVLPEPGLICRRDGPIRDLEAVDEAGRSLAAPAREVGYHRYEAYDVLGNWPAEVIRIPLRRPDAGARRIRRFRGVIPVEVASVRPRPALVIPLANSEGKTFHAAGAEITVKAAHVEPDGKMVVSVTGRLEGVMNPDVRRARDQFLTFHQYQIVDPKGGRPWMAGGSTGGGPNDGFEISQNYAPQPGSSFPTEFRLYDLDRAAWAIPFEFRDVPLP
jgi:hypothetical protein